MSATQTKVPAGTWNLDPVHSAVGFEVDYLAGTFRGQFRDVQAELGIAGSGGAGRTTQQRQTKQQKEGEITRFHGCSLGKKGG